MNRLLSDGESARWWNDQIKILIAHVQSTCTSLTKSLLIENVWFHYHRTFRNWWKKLPAHHKEKYLTRGVLFLNKERLIIITGGLGGVCIGFYFFHVEETPFTHRSRFMPITNVQMNELAETEYKEILERYAECILPVNHADHTRVFHVAQRLIRANKCKEMDHLKWQVIVVFSDEVNAFVLPVSNNFVLFPWPSSTWLCSTDSRATSELFPSYSRARGFFFFSVWALEMVF